MGYRILIFLYFISAPVFYAQGLKEVFDDPTFKIDFNKIDSISKDQIKYWIFRGKIDFTYSQTNILTDWASDEGYILSSQLNLLLQTHFLKKKITWDNRLIFNFGITDDDKSDFLKKSNDILDINTLLGNKLSKNWFLSSFISFNTQIAKGYKYEKINDQEIRIENSDFLSPSKIKLGFGILWKKDNYFKINIAPITFLEILVDSKYTLPDAKYYGVPEGDNNRFELGANIELFYNRLYFDKHLEFVHILNTYSNYLENINEIDIEYNLTINLKLLKIFAVNYNLRSIYNFDVYDSIQLLHNLGFGFSYKF